MKLKHFVAIALSLAPTQLVASEKQLLKIQEAVNLSVEFVPEQGDRDVWRIPSINGRGDCEDFALLKRKLLIEQGWDEKDIHILLVFRKTNAKTVYEGHTVLYVKSMDMVLDSPAVGSKRQNLYPEPYESYMKKNSYSFYCKFDNIETKKKFKQVSDRCGVRKKELI